MCKLGDVEWHAEADNPAVDKVNRCNSCQKDLSNHKDILRLAWGEGDPLGEIVWSSENQIRYFCSIECLVQNFGHTPRMR